MKIALIGQDIPALLPSLLADAYFACKWPVELAIEERQDALGDLLGRYADAVLRQSGVEGRILVTASRGEALRGADAVVYAGDYLAASRFRMDREALLGDEDDPGLSDQARVNGGLGGLMHTLRQGELLRQLCDAMEEACPNAVVVTMGQPVGRTAAILEKRGHRAWGLGPSPFKGPGGVEDIARRLGRKTQEVNAVTAGLPGFAFLTELRDQRGKDLLPAARELAERGELGRLTQRWLARWDALAVGFAVGHAEFLPAQEDFTPEAEPAFGESVERRKERILRMNTVADKGLSDREGMMAQMLLLSTAPAERPMRLLSGLLRGESVTLPAVTRLNRGALPQLPGEIMVECPLRLENGKPADDHYRLSEEAAHLCLDIGETGLLAAEAALGDASALREYVETDPAMEGLDRLYLEEVAARMARMHSDILSLYDIESEE